MDKVVYSQQSIFHLYRLGLAITRQTGKRYHLQDEEELNSIIKMSDRSNDPRIGRQLSAFLDSIEPEILDGLEAEGLIRPSRYFH
jgi:hypothetical protein